MAARMHKLLQQGILPYPKLQNSLNILPSLLNYQPNLNTLSEYHNVHNFRTEKDSNTISTCLLQEKADIDNGFRVFPCFSFEFFLDPKLSSGLHQIEAVKAKKSDLDESQTMWADSVKKKRKKKMNKHKLRKLRKRIRGYA
ncbi:hypothetical protein CDL12_21808 [Handroanthus impetiginosus]|uniref:Small ribosomal subunit protein mS38 n=1 Tax=Handroanthus impetiginosus TaxID=429701 RepID=A0A2G9GK34_9LAMI|nr:hypothetical protein CDL12_21807 [Handroanthus impetiginosus]PIN05657.1 hypothetical protein CDL12_21808 [Handroanthus impetiginosus]